VVDEADIVGASELAVDVGQEKQLRRGDGHAACWYVVLVVDERSPGDHGA